MEQENTPQEGAEIETPAGEQIDAQPVHTSESEPVDYQADRDKWKALARKHENEKKAQAKELESLRAQGMSESEKLIADAEERGKAFVRNEMLADLARAKLAAKAASAGANIDSLIDVIDVAKLIDADGVNDEAITALVESLPKTHTNFGASDFGVKSPRTNAITLDDLKSMPPEKINEARKKGELSHLMGN